ncbi:peroxiredoxin family protein [Metabacillus sp. GX 13764]|uniref:peroxiredoxin family protein n=1 Tax=Metabacillus kandeliae TaxID=2900151 RepID=UPI001E4F12F2|nr:peroxiredoxin family protein [Metabacillus kandeliae]MCD7034227.1 peroxiredoxin family protein [Metabacillus kandeliae]
MFQLGEKVPDFRLPSVKGEELTLSSHQEEHNSWHFIIFFRGAWCPVCVEDLKNLQENAGFFEGKNVHLITVSSDKLDNLQKMAEEEGLSLTMLSDEDLKVSKEYGVYYHGEDAPYEDHGAHGEPAYFLINENGELLYQQRQTSPFGRPSATELRKIVQYISKNLKK